MNDYINHLVPYNPLTLRGDNSGGPVSDSLSLISPHISTHAGLFTILRNGEYITTPTGPESYGKPLRMSMMPTMRQAIKNIPFASTNYDMGVDRHVHDKLFFNRAHFAAAIMTYGDKKQQRYSLRPDLSERYNYMDRLSDSEREAVLAEYRNDTAYFYILADTFWKRPQTLLKLKHATPVFEHDIHGSQKNFIYPELGYKKAFGDKFRMDEEEIDKIFEKVKKAVDRTGIQEALENEDTDFTAAARERMGGKIEGTIPLGQETVSIYSRKAGQFRFDEELELYDDSVDTFLVSRKSKDKVDKCNNFEDFLDRYQKLGSIIHKNLIMSGFQRKDMFDGERFPLAPDFKHLCMMGLSFYYRVDAGTTAQLMVPIMEGALETNVPNRYNSTGYVQNNHTQPKNGWETNDWVGTQNTDVINQKVFPEGKNPGGDCIELPPLSYACANETGIATRYAYVNLLNAYPKERGHMVEPHTTHLLTPSFQEGWNSKYLPEVLRINPEDCFFYKVYAYVKPEFGSSTLYENNLNLKGGEDKA